MPAIEEFPDVAETSAVHEFPAIEEFPDADAAAAGGAESVSPPSSAFDSSRLGADQAALLNLQDTLRGYNPAALNPMPEPAGGALVEATETPLDKVWRLVRQSKALRPVFGDPGSSGDDFQQRGIPATLASIPARPFVGAGKGAQAVVGDVAELEQGNPTLENLSAASRGEALPVLDKIASAALEEHERGEFGVPSLLAHISLGMADLAPKLLAMQGGPAMAGSVFGTGPDNSFDVSAGAMGAVLPGISEGTRAVVADAVDAGVKRGATWLAQPAVEKTLQVAANQAAMDGVMALQQSPELLELAESDPREFKRRVAELVGSNLAFAVPEIMRKTPTQEVFEGEPQNPTGIEPQRRRDAEMTKFLNAPLPETRNVRFKAEENISSPKTLVDADKDQVGYLGIQEFPAESSPAEAVQSSDPGLVQTPGAVAATPAAPESSLVPESGTLQAIAEQKPVTAQRVARVEASKPYTVEQALKDLPSVVQELKAALEANRLKPPEVSSQLPVVSSQPIQPARGDARPTTAIKSAERSLEYTLLDAVKDNGGLGGPDLETAMREMAAGKTAAQVTARYGAEYDALADVLETIFEARRGKKNNNVANQLAKAYEQAGFGGNRKGVDQALLGMTEAHQQGMGVAGGLPADHGDLIGRAWEMAQTRAKGGRELPQSAEGKAELFWQTATEPQNKVGQGSLFKAGEQKPAGWDKVEPGAEQRTLDVGAGKRFAEYMRKSFPNTLPVEIVATEADLPAGVQRRAQALGVSGVKGVVTEGKVYLVAGNLRDVREAGRIWLHEQAGHFATDKVLGPQLRSFAAGVERSFRGTDLMADIRRRYPGAGEVTLGREYMAKLAENPASDPAAWRKVVARVREWLRSLGFNLEVSENDVREVLRRAMGSLKGGETAETQRRGESFAGGETETEASHRLESWINQQADKYKGTPGGLDARLKRVSEDIRRGDLPEDLREIAMRQLKHGKFVRRGPNATERMERAGWEIVKNDPAKPGMAANSVAESGEVRDAKPAGKPPGGLIQDTLFAAGEPAERIAELRRPVQELEDKLRAANKLFVHPDQRRAAGLSKQQAANQRDVATAEFRRAQDALRENPEYIEATMRRQNELMKQLRGKSGELSGQQKADLEGEFETLQAELEAAPKKIVAYIHAQKFMTGEERTPREERAGSEAAGTANIQHPPSNAEIAAETQAARRKKVLKELPERTREVFQAAGKTKDKLTNLWTARENRDVIAYTFDAAENGGNLFGKQAANEVLHALNRSFGATGDRVQARNPVLEQALTFVIESGLNEGELNAFETTIRGSAFADTRAGKDALAAIKFAQTHWERLAPVAELYSKITDAQVEHENLAGVETLHRKGGYVLHMNDLAASQPILDIGANSGFGPASPFLKVRQYATYADAVANGIKPKSINAVDLLQKRLATGQKLINHGAFVDGLRRITFKLNDGETELPVVTELQTHVRQDGKEYEAAPPGYTMMEYAGQKFAVLQGGFDKLLKSLITPGTLRDSLIGNLAMEAAGTIKHGMLVFDSYHLGRLMFWNSMVRGMGLPGNPAAYKRGLTLLDQTMPEIKRMVEAGEIPAKLGADLIESKRQLNLLVSKGLNVGGAADNIATHFVQHLPIAGRFNRFLFEKFQRGATAEAALIELRRQQQMNPKVPEEVLARRVAKDLNIRFGNLQNQSWITNKNVAQLLRMLFLAPQWNESLIRSEMGALKELGQAVPDSVRNRQLAIGLLGRSVFTAALGTFLANQVINYITRGTPTWENPEESEVAKISAWIPDVVGNGPGYFLNPLTLPAEISELLMKKAERSGDLTKAIEEATASRLGPLGRFAYTFKERKDRSGQPVEGWGVVAQAASNLIPVPISGGTIAAAAKQMVTGEPEENYPGQFQRQAFQTFGAKLDSAPTPEQRMQALAREFNREKGLPPGPEGYHRPYYALDTALRMGNKTKTKAALDDLLLKYTPKQISARFKDRASDPFTGQKSREVEFLRTLNQEQRQTYEASRQQRRLLRDKVNALLGSVGSQGR